MNTLSINIFITVLDMSCVSPYSKLRSVEKILRSSTIGPRMVMEPLRSDSTLEYGTHWRRAGRKGLIGMKKVKRYEGKKI